MSDNKPIPSAEVIYVCKVCSKSYKSELWFQKHTKTHKPETQTILNEVTNSKIPAEIKTIEQQNSNNKRNIRSGYWLGTQFYFTIKSKQNCQLDEYISPLEQALTNWQPGLITVCREKPGPLDSQGRPKAYKSYGNLPIAILQQVWQTNHHLYEVIRQEHKPYFDIEFKFETEEHRHEIFQLIIQLLTEAFQIINVPFDHLEHSATCYNLGVAEKGIFAGLQKASYHLIINNGYKFTSWQESNKFGIYLRQLIFTKPEYAKLNTAEGPVIDLAVYNKNRCFKLPYQSKAGSPRTQTPINQDLSHDLKHFLISWGINEYTEINCDKLEIKDDYKGNNVNKIIGAAGHKFIGQNWNWTAMEEFKSSIINVKTINIPDGEPSYNIEYLVASIYNGSEIGYKSWLNIGSAIKRCCQNDSQKGLALFTRWTLKYDPTTSAAKLHTAWQSFSTETCGFKTLLGLARICNPVLDTFATTTNHINCLFNTDTMPSDIPVIKVNKQFINFTDLGDNWTCDETDKTIFIKSAMGTGKTFNFIKFISDRTSEKKQQDAKTYRVIYLSSRRAFAESTFRDFASVGLMNYLSCVVQDQDKIIISLESLTRLSQTQIHENDLLIIDESESIFNIISSPTLINSEYVDKLLILYELIKHSKIVFVMDAFLTNRSIQSVIACRQINNMTTKFYINEWQPAVRKYMLLECPRPNRQTTINIQNHQPSCPAEKLIAQIKIKLRAGKRCVLVTGSSTVGHTLISNCQDIPGLTYKFYHSANPLNLDVNVNTEWAQCKLLVYSPTITCGISYTNANQPFDNLFIYAVNHGSCHFRDIIQAHKRIRKFTDPIIYITINTRFRGFNPEQYPLELREIHEIYSNYRRELFTQIAPLMPGIITPRCIAEIDPKLNWIYDIHCYNIQERNIHSKYLNQVAARYLEIENIRQIQPQTINGTLAIRTLDPGLLIDANNINLITRAEFVRLGNLIQFRQNTETEFQEWFKYRVWTECNMAPDTIKQSIFQKYAQPDKLVYYDNAVDFMKYVRADGIHSASDNDILEVYSIKKLQFTNLYIILKQLGLITITLTQQPPIILEYGINTDKEWNTSSYTPELMAQYSAMNRKTINQLFNREYLELSGQFTTRTMTALLSKLIKEVFNMEVIKTGDSRKRINSAQVLITSYKITNSNIDIFKYL